MDFDIAGTGDVAADEVSVEGAEEAGVRTAPRMTSARAAGRNQVRSMDLRLQVTDPEVLNELLARADGDLERYALAALRLGVLSLRMAEGQVDATSIKEAGDKLLAEVRELLTHRSQALTGDLARSMSAFLDPKTGALPQQLDSLLKEGGQLEALLKGHLGQEDSVLARSLAKHLGDGSPIFRLLSPTDANGLQAQVQKLLEAALTEQRTTLLKEFSLDSKESALSRLVTEISSKQSALSDDLRGQVDVVVKEFSLDKEDSALSRLVTRVEAAQSQIAAEFTTDNAGSALSRLTRLLGDTSDSIHKNLTLDDEGSALARLKRELLGTLNDQAKKNTEFQEAVRTTLAELRGKKESDASSTRHGLDFESRLGELLASEAQRQADLFEATGNTTGCIKACKKGDFVVQLGPDSPAPEARIVFEAKDVAGYTLKAALAELDQSRKNRSAQLGVFVFAKRNAPEALQPFSRYGNDLIVLWDDEDPTTDVYVKAAYSTARALSLREAAETEGLSDALETAERAIRAIEKEAGYLEEITKAAETSKGAAEKILGRVGKMKASLEKQVEELDEAVAELRQTK